MARMETYLKDARFPERYFSQEEREASHTPAGLPLLMPASREENMAAAFACLEKKDDGNA